MTPVLCSVHNELGLGFVVVGRPERVTLELRNTGEQSFDLTAPVPSIRVDLGEVELDADAVTCPGFRVARWADGVLELEADLVHGWWFPGEARSIELPGLSVTGDAGVDIVEVTLAGFFERDLRLAVPLVKLRAAGDVVASWLDGNALVIAPPHVAARTNALTVRVEAGEGRVVVAPFGALIAPARAGDARLSAADARSTVERLPTGQPVWTVTPAPGEERLDLTLSGVVAAAESGPAGVLVSTEDGFAVLDAELVGASVVIKRFEVDPDELRDIDRPTPVYVSWEVENASTVTLSGLGVVGDRQERLEFLVEESTTFILTAYDSAFHTIVSGAARVEVEPDLASRMVPAGTIMAWRGLLTDIPVGWTLCDGQNGTPDLRDRFVVGAGLSDKPHAHGEAESHSHLVGPVYHSINTEGAGYHSHGMPTKWYARNLTDGGCSGIDTRGAYSSGEQTQSDGWHTHRVSVSLPAFMSEPNTGGIRPKWYALAYIMKTGWSR
jgi:hypothetical protein